MSQAAPRSKRRAILLKLALLGISTLVSVALLEIVVRVCLPFYAPGRQIIFHLSEDGVPIGPPNSTARQATPKGDFDLAISFNQYGFRDQKDFKNAAPDDFYALGDSFTLGWGVEEEERYANQAEKLLHRPIYNVAIPENLRGYAKLLSYAERHGAKVRNLVLGVCMENDLKNYYKDGRGDFEPDTSNHGGATGGSMGSKLRWWFKQHSAAYNAASFTLQKNRTLRRVMEKAGVARTIEELTPEHAVDDEVLKSSRDEILNLTSNRNAVVLIIPSRGLWNGKNMEEEKKFHARFVELLNEAKLNVLDVKPRLEKDGHALDYYFATDPHWNAAGQALAGEELAKFIQNNPGLFYRAEKGGK